MCVVCTPQSEAEWKTWCESGARPANVPCNPQHVYAHQGWQGWWHWLRGGDATHARDAQPETQAHARTLKADGGNTEPVHAPRVKREDVMKELEGAVGPHTDTSSPQPQPQSQPHAQPHGQPQPTRSGGEPAHPRPRPRCGALAPRYCAFDRAIGARC